MNGADTDLSLNEAVMRADVALDRLIRTMFGRKDAQAIYDLQMAYLAGFYDGTRGRPCEPGKVVE